MSESTALTLVQRDYLPAVDPVAVEQAMMIGDLAQMTPEVRIAYYIATCKSIGLNPLTRPFQAFKADDGQILLYPDKGCAEQLRKRDRISIRILSREYVDDLYIVTVEASTPDGRKEESEGVATIMEEVGTWAEGTKRNGETYRYKKPTLGPDGQPLMRRLTGKQMENARMRAETKAKRRVTLGICGLGTWADLEQAHPMRFDPQSGTLAEEAGVVDVETGELLDKPEEADKGFTKHANDLFGDAPRVDNPRVLLIWRDIAQWYEDAGQAGKYQACVTLACKRFAVDTIEDMALGDAQKVADGVYAKLRPLIEARRAAQESQEEANVTDVSEDNADLFQEPSRDPGQEG